MIYANIVLTVENDKDVAEIRELLREQRSPVAGRAGLPALRSLSVAGGPEGLHAV